MTTSTSVCGDICQNAYVVADIDQAIEFWVTRLGVGPFYKFPSIDFVEAEYKGVSQSFEFEAALAYSGDLQIELIKPKGPSIFQNFLDAGSQGINHLCRLTDDMDAAHAEMESRGAKQLQRGVLGDGSVVAYYSLGNDDGMLMEIACLKDDVTALFDAIKQAANDWDGQTRTINF